MSEVLDSIEFNEPFNDADSSQDELVLEDEDKEGSLEKNIWFFVLAAVLIGFFIWLLLGLWGYLQEMSYGHG